MWRVGGIREVHIGFGWGRTDGKRLLGILRNRWADNIKMDFKKWGRAWIELFWPKRGTGGGLL